MKILEEALKGSIRSLGKLISFIENESPGFLDILKSIYPLTGKAKIIGITGPPGVGKSTLVSRLAKIYLEKNDTVGILAVDPSSPISGGSLLGDRIRMSHLFPSSNIFVRSLSSRGTLGGISQATMNVARVLDAAGYNIIIIETVGVGQAEVEIIHVADTAVVVLAAGFGDEIQALKAGLMEVADIFVVNKADLPDTSKYVNTIEKILLKSSSKKSWTPPIVKTIALTGQGCDELVKKIDEHYEFCKENESLINEKRKRQLREIKRLVEQKIKEEIEVFFEREYSLEEIINNDQQRNKGPYVIAEEVLNAFWKSQQRSKPLKS
ncbi:MAG: methylmalonyl Co-A mutase-associated GTPase MeaB [Thermodesulfovibrionales bacterium]|nr:methylmalonyl Co-A mutase-associated GTPase MeaB [Thermodesulfovibrionales bacterium]